MSVGFVSNGGYKPVGASVVVTGGGAKPEQTKEVTITENGTTNVTPDTGKVLTGVGITVDVPSDMKPEQTKEVTILANGTSTVTPDTGKVLTEVEITVNVPSGSAATHLYGWNCHEEYNGETRDYPMIFNYNVAKDTLADFEAGLGIDGAIYNDNNNTRQNMELHNCSGWGATNYTKLSATSFQLTVNNNITDTFTLITDIPADQDIAVNQSVENVAHTIDVSQYSAPVEITPSNPDFVTRKVTVTLDNIPSGVDLEADKAATIDVSQYSAPVEVTPTAGKDGMEKVTVTLDNIPSGEAGQIAKMYGWSNGASTIYTGTENPTTEDYATTNLSTLYPITAIDTTNSTITVQGTVYNRNNSVDITMGPGDSYMYAWDYSDSTGFSNGSAILPVNEFEDITLNMKGWICDAASESLLEAEVTEISDDPGSQYVTLTSTKISGYSHTIYPSSRNKRLAVIYDAGETGKLCAWIDMYHNTVMYTGEDHNIGDIALMGNNGFIQDSWSITDSVSLANEISYDNSTWKFNNSASGSYIIHTDTLYAYKDGSGWVYTENNNPVMGDKVMYISFDGLPVTAEITAVSGNDITWYSTDTGAGATSTRYSQDDVTLPGSLSEYALTSYEHSEQEGYILTYKLDSTSNDKLLTLDYSTTSRPKIALSQNNITSVVVIQAIKTTHSSNELLRRWVNRDVLVGTSSIEVEANKATMIDVSQYSAPVEITPTTGKDAMGKVTVTLNNIPSGADLEANKAATIDVSQYSTPVEVTPTAGKDGMEKVTVTLNNIPQQIGLKPTEYFIAKVWDDSSAQYINRQLAGEYVWTDGEHTYCSVIGSGNYVFNEDTCEWETKTWYGLTNFSGEYIWTDGTDIYYSNGNDQYVLDKATSTWSAKTWTGSTQYPSGADVWTDGTDIYYSINSHQYVLDKSTSTWSAKTWTGLTEFSGNRVWTDGTNIYYSNGNSSQYVLDKSTSTWSVKTWDGNYNNLRGDRIWTDGTNIYFSYGDGGNTQRLSGDFWTNVTIYGFDDPNVNYRGNHIWRSMRGGVYYSDGNNTTPVHLEMLWART